MTLSRIHFFCNAHNINIGYFCGHEMYPRSTIEQNEALFLNNSLFCLIWESQGFSCNEAIKLMKSNWKT